MEINGVFSELQGRLNQNSPKRERRMDESTSIKSLKTVEIDAHAETSKKSFLCLLGCTEGSKRYFLKTELGLLAHMVYTHRIPPDVVVVNGWTEENESNYQEQLKSLRFNSTFKADIEALKDHLPRIAIGSHKYYDAILKVAKKN